MLQRQEGTYCNVFTDPYFISTCCILKQFHVDEEVEDFFYSYKGNIDI